MKPKYWEGEVRKKDDFNYTITDKFIDGKTVMGPWAIMTPQAFGIYGLALGVGYGQIYEKQANGRWLKTSNDEFQPVGDLAYGN